MKSLYKKNLKSFVFLLMIKQLKSLYKKSFKLLIFHLNISIDKINAFLNFYRKINAFCLSPSYIVHFWLHDLITFFDYIFWLHFFDYIFWLHFLITFFDYIFWSHFLTTKVFKSLAPLRLPAAHSASLQPFPLQEWSFDTLP